MQTIKRIEPLNLLFYFGGFMMVALGVILIIRSDLGAGPWDAVTYNLHVLTGITLGTASAIISGLIMTFVIVYRRAWRYFFMIVPILSIAVAIDFWDLVVFRDFYPEPIFLRLFMILFGLLIIGFGLACSVVSGYPAMVFEEWTQVLMIIFKTNSFYKVRIGIEMVAVCLASVFGFLAGIRFGAIGFGTFFLALTIGPTISFFLRTLSRKRHQNT